MCWTVDDTVMLKRRGSEMPQARAKLSWSLETIVRLVQASTGALQSLEAPEIVLFGEVKCLLA